MGADGNADSIGWVYITFSALCLMLTITEIVFILRRQLMPLIFLAMNVFKSTCWTALFILGFWGRFRVSQKTLPNILSLVVNIILMYVISSMFTGLDIEHLLIKYPQPRLLHPPSPRRHHLPPQPSSLPIRTRQPQTREL